MTAEMHNPRDNSDDDIFTSIMRGSWDSEPILLDTIDPGIKRLLAEAKQAEDALNYTDNPSENTIQEVLLNLNGDWDQLGFRDEPLKITAKLRPTEYAIEEDVADLIQEDSFPGLSTMAEDLRGSYANAAGYSVVIRGFDVESTALGEHGTAYRIILLLGLDEDYDDDQVWFSVYPDDIEYLEAREPTQEGAESFVRDNFPQLYEAIQALPEDCQDAELMRQALDDFVVTFDLSKADTTMGEDEVLDLIETYITDRLAFDNATYEATVNGRIYGRRMNYDTVPRDYQGTLRELLVGTVRLMPMEEHEGGGATYRPSLETWYLVPEQQGGRTPIYIPIDSLTKLVSNRPDMHAYPFDDDTYLMPNEQFEQEFQTEPLVALGKTATSLAEYDEELADDEEYDDETEDDDESAIERRRQFLLELQGLHEIARQYVSSDQEHVYATKKESKAAYDYISEKIQDFLKRWEGAGEVLGIAGEGLRLPTTTVERQFDEENERVVMAYRGIDVAEKDMFAEAKGLLQGVSIRAGTIDDDETQHVVRAYLIFRDISPLSMPTTIQDPDTELDLVTIISARNFLVDLGLPTGYSLPALEYAERREAAIIRTEKLPIGHASVQRLTRNLQTLAEGIDNESPSELTEYEEVEGLRDIALGLGDDVGVLSTVADAIETIMGHGRVLRLEGAYIDGTGNIVTDQGVVAKLDGVVAQHPHLKAPELAFVMLIPKGDGREADERVIVPLSTIESVAF